MALYETVFIARQDITSAQVDTMASAFSEIVTAQGGTVVKTESWGLRTLAYRINKNRKGHYVLFQLDATPAAKDELERNMGLHEDVLRFMTLKVEAHDPEPSVMMQNKGERRDYDRRREYDDRDMPQAEEIQI
jgi:small subunit ribosomal protein S6